MNLTAIQNDRAAGVLLATAAGDALGAGYEFTYPAADVEIGMIGGGLGFAPGEWTDDTSMAIGIAQVTAAGLDLRTPAGLDAVAANWIRWFDSHPTDIGNQTRTVLSQRDGSAAAMARTAQRVPGLKGGNGSLMRTAPVALAYLGDPEAAIDAARKVGQLTHDDPRATEACEMWTYGIHHAVLHGNFGGAREYLDGHPEAADYWGPLLDRAEKGSPQDFPKNGWVVDALLTAWWAIHQSPPTARCICSGRWSSASGPGTTPTRPPPSPAACSARAGAHPRFRPGGDGSCTATRVCGPAIWSCSARRP